MGILGSTLLLGIVGFAAFYFYSRLLPKAEEQYASFDISPSGDRVVFCSAKAKLYILDLRSREVKYLLPEGEGGMQPRFSPDGQMVVFSGYRNNGWSIYLVPATGGAEPFQLTHTPKVCDCFPSFSRDGRSIVFARALVPRPNSALWDKWDVYRCAVDGHHVVRLTNEKFHVIYSTQFLKADISVLFSAARNGSNQVAKLYTVDGAGSQTPRRLHPSEDDHGTGTWELSPRVSPDGTKFCYLADRQTAYRYDIFVADLDGQNERPLNITNFSSYNKDPLFVPKSGDMMFLARKSRILYSHPSYSLWKVSPDHKFTEIADTSLFSDPDRWDGK